ncbi:hypothetical protein AB0395_34915 [Streptosporangium sp. NPDC051023]|uniref:hypothetical protein n=1 Tax=Streptosporangium sp. NPDC051023 TaxID=3155410 RepID=UPI00344C4B59
MNGIPTTPSPVEALRAEGIDFPWGYESQGMNALLHFAEGLAQALSAEERDRVCERLAPMLVEAFREGLRPRMGDVVDMVRLWLCGPVLLDAETEGGPAGRDRVALHLAALARGHRQADASNAMRRVQRRSEMRHLVEGAAHFVTARTAASAVDVVARALLFATVRTAIQTADVPLRLLLPL